MSGALKRLPNGFFNTLLGGSELPSSATFPGQRLGQKLTGNHCALKHQRCWGWQTGLPRAQRRSGHTKTCRGPLLYKRACPRSPEPCGIKTEAFLKRGLWRTLAGCAAQPPVSLRRAQVAMLCLSCSLQDNIRFKQHQNKTYNSHRALTEDTVPDDVWSGCPL